VSGGDPTTWAASVAAAIKVARSGKVIAAADRGGKDWHFWAACAATQRSIIGVYKTQNDPQGKNYRAHTSVHAVST
jgi:hypothetical protein